MEGLIMHHPTTFKPPSVQDAVGLLLGQLAAGCEDGTAPTKPEPISSSAVIVSDPARSAGLVTPTKARTSFQDPVTYVSFEPGTFSSSGGTGAITILNRRTME